MSLQYVCACNYVNELGLYDKQNQEAQILHLGERTQRRCILIPVYHNCFIIPL